MEHLPSAKVDPTKRIAGVGDSAAQDVWGALARYEAGQLEHFFRWQKEAVEEVYRNFARSEKMWELAFFPPRVRVGTTPKDVIYEENKSSLYRYHPSVPPAKTVPVLIVYALINRLYILDLYSGRSFVEYLLHEGLPVYAVDWGVPGDEDRNISLDYYIEGYLDRMVRRTIEESGSPQISLFGYCIGGTLSAIYAARHPERVKNLVLLTTPINFEAGGSLRRIVDKKHFPVDRIVDTYGNVPPWFMEAGFKMMNPMRDIVKAYNFSKHVLDENFRKFYFAVESWVNDNVPFPGEVYRRYIKDLYQENRLFRGTLEICGERVDLGRINANHLTVAGSEDNIVPPAAAVCMRDLVSSIDNTTVVLPGGHIGVITGGRALKTTWPRIGDWLLEHSE